jgi:hypothetical protein
MSAHDGALIAVIRALADVIEHADSVATRLVEVICEQESEYDVAHQYFAELRAYDRNLIRDDVEKRVRAQIAADIEVVAFEGRDSWHPSAFRAFEIAARIARGDAP